MIGDTNIINIICAIVLSFATNSMINLNGVATKFIISKTIISAPDVSSFFIFSNLTFKSMMSLFISSNLMLCLLIEVMLYVQFFNIESYTLKSGWISDVVISIELYEVRLKIISLEELITSHSFSKLISSLL